MEVYSAIILGIFSSVCSNFGSNLQKYGFKHHTNPLISYWKNKYWLYGLGLNIIGTICDFVALSCAAQTIIVCLSGFGLVSNLFFTKYWLNEEVKLDDIVGVGLIAVGSAISVSFGNLNPQHFAVTDLINFYTKPGFIFYYLISLFAIGLLGYKIKSFNNIAKRIEMIDSNYNTCSNSQKSWLIISYEKVKSHHSLYLCALSGILGSFSILHGKILLEIIWTNSIALSNVITWFGIFNIIQLAFYLITQQHYLALSLKDFDAKYVIPVYNCFFMLNSVISGAIYFDELNDFTFSQSILFIFGILIILSGVRLLSGHHCVINDLLHDHKYKLINGSESNEIELYENSDDKIQTI